MIDNEKLAEPMLPPADDSVNLPAQRAGKFTAQVSRS